MTVADVVIQTLLRAGVGGLFASGAAGAGALADAARRHGLTLTHTATDEGACLMAAVTGELTDAPGVALYTGPESVSGVAPGPAPAGANRGLAYALGDHAPMILLVEGAAAPSAPAVKGDAVAEPASAAHWTAHAVQLALTEPRGPVRLAVPRAMAEASALPLATALRPPAPSPPDPAALDEAARVLVAAARPLLVAGRGCLRGDAGRWLRPLAEALPAPVLVTLKAKGVLPDAHPLALGLLAAGVAAETLGARADLVVAIGLDPAETIRAPWPPKASVLHLGSSTDDGTANAVTGDAALIIEELAPRLRGRSQADWDVAELDRLKRAPAALRTAGPLTPTAIARIARELAPAGTIAVVDGTLDATLVAHGWAVLGLHEFVAPLRAGLPAFALTAAMAAQLACADRRVLAFTTAGALADEAAELESAVAQALPLILIVLGDGPGAARSADQVREALGRAFSGGRRARVLVGPV